MINCKQCDKEITNPNKIFCNRECNTIFKRRNLRTINCLECNKQIITNSKKQRFCSSKCYGRYNAKNPGVIQKQQEKNRIIKICENCCEEYEVHNYRKNSKFCSKSCFTAYGRRTIICPTCGIEFTTQANDKQKYCSYKCFRMVISNSSKAENEIKNFLKENNFIHNKNRIFYDDNMFIPDICIGNKIIEYYGEYWHCSPRLFEAKDFNTSINLTAKEKWERDEKRIHIFKKLGYNVLIIWENDYNLYKEEILLKCLNFLKE